MNSSSFRTGKRIEIVVPAGIYDFLSSCGERVLRLSGVPAGNIPHSQISYNMFIFLFFPLVFQNSARHLQREMVARYVG